ncbi:glycosyltransferase family 2 protein [Aliarcobacter cryaerophilus]|uniref:glycosyltransferase family 2 protein n=1 Tax=Aliarcobacter cryaerophilus TaxID=28198 RepID=UPI0021B6472E|nr:glycosyltransferase family 2 protein [Aliarcobacter cryaerophilus]MCT7520068.1 glycosyltransferase family 2 protein [Aliarcobacter cryaerophilus]
MKHTISVILPNYNGKSLLLSNIPSIVTALENSKYDFEIIVVDDCSTDDSVEMLKKEFSFVRIIINETNQGFSYTCNRGIFSARNSILCIVNTDVTFTPTYFTQGIKYFDDKNVFALKGNIINYQNNTNEVVSIEKTAKLFIKRGFLRFDKKVEHIPNSFTGEIGGEFVLLGCCFLCDRHKAIELKGFDEIYSPFYWEDSDISLRALRKGYKLVYEPSCVVYHKTSSTIPNFRSSTKIKLVSNRNKFIFTWKYLKGIKQWSSHIFYTLLNVATRWVLLDWKYYVSFFNALIRVVTFKHQ